MEFSFVSSELFFRKILLFLKLYFGWLSSAAVGGIHNNEWRVWLASLYVGREFCSFFRWIGFILKNGSETLFR